MEHRTATRGRALPLAAWKRPRRIAIAPYLFIAPAILYLLVVTVVPALMALPISFTDWTALSPKRAFVGLSNYRALLGDRALLKSLGVMAQFFVSVPLVMACGLVTALLLNNKLRGITFFRVVLYSPVITSTIAVAVLFEWFYQPTFGLFNGALGALGLPPLGWLSDPRTAIPSVILFRVWKGAGAAMLIYLAGLQDVPESLKEAALMDGAGALQRFWRITLPLLRPANAYLLVTGVIGVFMIFQETYMLKGPLDSTTTVINYVYEKGFGSSEMGYASAISFVLFAIVLAATMAQFRGLGAESELGS